MKTYKVLGMMSGTSLDGLDIAFCHLWQEDAAWNFEIRACTTIDYDPKWELQLKNAIHLTEGDHQKLHIAYGKWLGQQAKSFIKTHDLAIDFIASHGHTSHHRPKEGVTFQLGDGAQLAKVSGQKVICDFRSLDVQLGGQGAPLVPIGDELLLPEYEFCLNLGGISNMSFSKKDTRIAYDIGMANMPLNYITQKIGLKFDRGGKLAKTGKVDLTLLKALNQLPYYKQSYPKSTGYEWFLEKVVPLIANSKASTEDLLHTIVVHNCHQIAKAIKAEKPKKGSKVLVTGGGALNPFFIDCLKEALGDSCQVQLPPKKFIEYKEALVFALMGVLKVRRQTNVLASVTGAKRDSCSGTVYLPLKAS
ncbi:MAG: anhydro-N-acetylmuramic acid kinase [Croceitalea sp.]|nr:anhydro-N-acetylmuramic acid kinase [Croceitalea sp.]